jgi:hypothetical protein
VRSYPVERADQDWSFLENPANRTDPFDSLEYIPLKAAEPDWYASIGAEIRYGNESIGNDGWGAKPYENSYLLMRNLLITDFHLGSRLRFFGEFESDDENGRIGGPRPVDDAWLDSLAAFIEAELGPTPAGPTLLFGREELSLGSGRLVGTRNFANVQQSFTGFRSQADVGSVHLDALDVRPDEDNPQVFDEPSSPGTSLWGVYASTKPTFTRPEIDAYYLGIVRDQYTIARGTGRELRHSIGTRFARPFEPNAVGLDYDDDAVYQFGTFAGHPISAWALMTSTAWHFGPSPASPRFLLKADIASGDDPNARTVGTFDPYFGLSPVQATTGAGLANAIDIHPSVTTEFGPVSAGIEYMWYWRQRVTDGLYGLPGTLLRPPSGSLAHFVGDRPGATATWQIDRHAYVQGYYGFFTAGTFIHESGPALPLIYRDIAFGYKF